MQQTCHNAIWNSNVFSDWCANAVCDYAQPDNPHFSLFKARVLAATMPAFLALQLSFELLLLSVPRALYITSECIVILVKGVVQLANHQETCLGDLQDVVAKIGKTLVKIVKVAFVLLAAVGFMAAGLVAPVKTMKFLEDWGVISKKGFPLLPNQRPIPVLPHRIHASDSPIPRAILDTQMPTFDSEGNSSLLAIEPEKAVPISQAGVLAETLVADRLIQNRALLESIRVHGYGDQARWKTITDQIWKTNENCTRLKRLIDKDKDRFYLELSSPELGSHFLYGCFIYPWKKSYLEFLIRETPKHFLDKLVKRDAYAELDSEDRFNFASANGVWICNFFRTDSWLEVILGQKTFKEENIALLRLFSESYPEMWLKQALQSGSIPLLYRFNKEELHVFFQAYPYLYQQHLNWENESNCSFDAFLRNHINELVESGEGVEIALLIKDKHLLYQIRERLGSEEFAREIQRLCLKYPTLEQELLEIETRISQEPCQCFESLNFSLETFLLQNVDALPYRLEGIEAILFTKDQQLLNRSIQRVGVEKFNAVVSMLCIRDQELLGMVARASQEHDQEVEEINIEPEVILKAWVFKCFLSHSRGDQLNLNHYSMIERLLFEELLNRKPEIIFECLSTLDLFIGPIWGYLIWDPDAKALLKSLLERMPDLFMQNLRSITNERLIRNIALLPNGLVNHHHFWLRNVQDPRYRHHSGDSLLDSIIKQHPGPEQSASLLRLFEECIPDLWMRLVFRHGYQLPLPMAEIQPSAEMSLEKRLEHAIIMKSVDLLKELCQEMNDAPFKLAMKRLRNKYPAYSAEILELEQQASPRFGLSFFDNFVDIDLVFQA